MNNEREILDWLWEGRGEIYGWLPPHNAGEALPESETAEVESAPE